MTILFKKPTSSSRMITVILLCLMQSILILSNNHFGVVAFVIPTARTSASSRIVSSSTEARAANDGINSSSSSTTTTTTNKNGDNKAMLFLKKIGKVGTKVDFTHAIGVDEGSGGEKVSSSLDGKCEHDIAIKKANHAYKSCVESGTIDDLSEAFPITSSGTRWAGVTDNVMGGVSSGTLVRKDFNGRISNVLTANVRLENNGGFVQMVTDLALDHSVSMIVDASQYKGLEFDLFYTGDADKEKFNVHLKDSNCLRQFSSYRATFELPSDKWTTVKLPWTTFDGFGPGAEGNIVDQSNLRRIGLVAYGKKMDVTLALSSIRLF